MQKQSRVGKRHRFFTNPKRIICQLPASLFCLLHCEKTGLKKCGMLLQLWLAPFPDFYTSNNFYSSFCGPLMKWTDLKTLICRRRKLLLKLISLSFDQKHPTTTNIHCTTIHHYLVCLSNEAFSRVQLTMQLIIVSSSFFPDFSASQTSKWVDSSNQKEDQATLRQHLLQTFSRCPFANNIPKIYISRL